MNYFVLSESEHRMSETTQVSIEKLKQELSLNKLQINSILTVTQAINDNVPALELFGMYKSFIGWEMGIKRMALFFLQDDVCECTTHLNADNLADRDDLAPLLQRYTKLQRLTEKDPVIFHPFEFIIPVYHKTMPIAFALVGGLREDTDEYSKLQFITTYTNIIAVAIENKRLFKKQLEQERIGRDLELASHVQKMLIPEHNPQSPYFDIATVYKPNLTVGGDYYDFIPYDDQRITFCIADISGKGVSAAILMANFQAILQSLIYQYRDLETFIVALNQAVYRITKSDRYLTLFIGDLNIKTKELQYINAGHYPPYLYQRGEVVRLDMGCTIIGAFENLPGIELGKVSLAESGTIFACTDGVVDVQNDIGDYFDDVIISKMIQDTRNLKHSNDINNSVLEKLEKFNGSRPYPDDIAILTCKFKLS